MKTKIICFGMFTLILLTLNSCCFLSGVSKPSGSLESRTLTIPEGYLVNIRMKSNDNRDMSECYCTFQLFGKWTDAVGTELRNGELTLKINGCLGGCEDKIFTFISKDCKNQIVFTKISQCFATGGVPCEHAHVKEDGNIVMASRKANEYTFNGYDNEPTSAPYVYITVVKM